MNAELVPLIGILAASGLVAGFAADEDATHRPCVANRGRTAAADFFRRRQIHEVVAMTLAWVDNLQTGRAPCGEEHAVWLDGAPQ